MQATPIRQMWRGSIDPLAKRFQILIVPLVIEWPKRHFHRVLALRNHPWQMKKGSQAFPGRMGVGWWKIVVSGPHYQVHQRYFEDGHHLIFAVVQLIHRSLLCFEVF
jgi:hypothetical protein